MKIECHDFAILNTLKEKNIETLDINDLKKLAHELRSKIIFCQNSNGFLGSCLGVVELSIALHRVFDLNSDLLFWDIGHQTLPHDYLVQSTERAIKDSIHTKNQSIILKKTSAHKRPAQVLSEAIGNVIYRDLFAHHYDIITVIGDRSLASGQAFEALNHLGAMASKKIIILNDNSDNDKESTSGLCEYLQHLKPKSHYFDQHSLFESLGFNYIGPIDGHDFNALLETLTILKKSKEQTPVILHIKTKKGKGYAPAEADQNGLNSVTMFDPQNGRALLKVEKNAGHFATQTLIELAHQDPHIVLIGLHTPYLQSPFLAFKDLYPERFFEVGVTESHAISLASSLAEKGLKPYLVVHSSFSQQVIDLMMVDVCLNKTPVRLIIDHTEFGNNLDDKNAKLYESNFLNYLPNLTIMSPFCVSDIQNMIYLSAKETVSPSIIYLPKTLPHKNIKPDNESITIGKARILKNSNGKVAILSYGDLLNDCLAIGDLLTANGFPCTIVDILFIKPFDRDFLIQLATNSKYILSIEENEMGSLSTQILHCLNNNKMFDCGLSFKPFYRNTKKHRQQENKSQAIDLFQEIRTWISKGRGDEDFISVA
jgi:1-deoxy-D-xylulose-5-phosphate synthase